MSIDYNRVALLLHVMEGASKHGTEFNFLTNEARAELKAVQEKVVAEKAEETKAKAEDDAARAAADAKRKVPIFPKDSGTKVDPALPSDPAGEPVDRRTV